MIDQKYYHFSIKKVMRIQKKKRIKERIATDSKQGNKERKEMRKGVGGMRKNQRQVIKEKHIDIHVPKLSSERTKIKHYFTPRISQR